MQNYKSNTKISLWYWITGMSTKYDILGTLLSYAYFTMYYIVIDDKVVQTISDRYVAYANYRAVCRDFINKPKQIKLLDNDTILHTKAANMQLLDNIDEVSTNDILGVAMNSLNIDVKQLKTLIKDSQLQLSSSRIDGWIKDASDRKFVQMYNDELYVILQLMLKSSQSAIKTPTTITALRKQLGLTQSELAEKLGLKSGHRQVARWEAGEAEMSDARWQKMQGFLKNI